MYWSHVIKKVHKPVLVNAVLELLNPRPGMTVVDGTVGSGGHAEAIIPKILPGGCYVGLDRDPEALERAQKRLSLFGDAVLLLHGNFGKLREVIKPLKIKNVDLILLDLGTSRCQIESSFRGFSFRVEGPLDMRMDPKDRITAKDLVNKLSERELKNIFWEYGEEPFSGRFAKIIVNSRKRHTITTTKELADLIIKAMPKKIVAKRKHYRIHPATRVFQALRIAVNKEMEALASVLLEAYELLPAGGRMCVLSYHSLEDRKVKEFIKNNAFLAPINKKAIKAGKEEVISNPSARSVRLRGAIKERCDMIAGC